MISGRKQAGCACLRGAASLLLLLLLCACQDSRIGSTGQGAIAGGAIGAGLGAIVGNQSGHPGTGAAIGSAVGALSGGLIGSQFDQDDRRLKERGLRMQRQEDELAENRKLIGQLRDAGAEAHITPRGVVVNLPDVLFEFDSATLTPAARRTVADIARAVNGVKDRTVAVEGHTDSVGEYGYNQRLSERRAKSVAGALQRNRVDPARIRTRGYGETRPVASNDTGSGRGRNRRVEVIIENRHT